MKSTASAPGKLMLLGEHAVVYNRPCIVTAVDQRMKATAQFLNAPVFQLEAPDVGLKNYQKPLEQIGKGEIPKEAKFAETATRLILAQEKAPEKGIKITTKSQFSALFGFGSSSASTVAIVSSLANLFGKKLSQKKLFEICYQTVLEVQGKGSGFDIAAAIYGGTLYFVTGGKTIKPTIPPSPTVSARSAWPRISHNPTIPLIIGYTGIKADTVTLIDQVKMLSEKYPKIVENSYDQIAKLVENAKIALINKDWQTLGQLMNFNQGYLEGLGVSSRKLAELIYAARDAGAYGAKLSGAGGGDCMIALVSPQTKSKVAKAIEKTGGKVINVSVNTQGVKFENS